MKHLVFAASIFCAIAVPNVVNARESIGLKEAQAEAYEQITQAESLAKNALVLDSCDPTKTSVLGFMNDNFRLGYSAAFSFEYHIAQGKILGYHASGLNVESEKFKTAFKELEKAMADMQSAPDELKNKLIVKNLNGNLNNCQSILTRYGLKAFDWGAIMGMKQSVRIKDQKTCILGFKAGADKNQKNIDWLATESCKVLAEQSLKSEKDDAQK